MLKDTWPQYIFIRTVILFLQWLGPVCLAWTTWNTYTTYPEWPIRSATSGYLAAESAFYLFFLYYRLHLQRSATHPRARTEDERRNFFAKVRSEIHDPVKFLQGWFRGADITDIGREELRRFLDWAFWDGKAKLGEAGQDEAELMEYYHKVEKMMPQPFAEGTGKAKSLRLTLDPIEMECRTLGWYGLMMLADTATHVSMVRNGLRYYKTKPTSLGVFPPRPLAAVATRTSPARNLSYWYRAHTSKTRLPVIYIHGIGVGLIAQIAFLRELDQKLNGDATLAEKDGEVGILALEILQISSRLAQPILRREDFLAEFTQIVDACGFNRFVVCSHSYGSVLHTQLLTHPPLADRIGASFLIDPVTLLLHMPDVAYNFTVRPPKSTSEWQLWYFGSKDPGTAHTLGRHFFWSENLLWRDRLVELVDQGMKVTASLASEDLIVDTESVGLYLSENEVPDPALKTDEKGRDEMELQNFGSSKADAWKRRAWNGKGLEMMWWEGLDHAQVFDTLERRARLVDVLVEYSWDRR